MNPNVEIFGYGEINIRNLESMNYNQPCINKSKNKPLYQMFIDFIYNMYTKQI